MDEHVDWTDWPLIEVSVDGVPVPEVPSVVARALRTAVERTGSFAAVVHMPDTAMRAPRLAGAVERVRMLRKLRPGLSKWCCGLAFVMSQAAQQENAKALKSSTKIWGCPTTATDDPGHARDWALQQLSIPQVES